ncbi:TerD family protein [Candidatus Protofrankia datiscae]|uniref:TerD family protein n=2 Tax=Candidatus Protofrankia datiscae TaxID=2716812 RepID=UPI000A059E55
MGEPCLEIGHLLFVVKFRIPRHCYDRTETSMRDVCAATGAAIRKGGNVTLSALADELGSISVMLEWAVENQYPLDADASILLLGDDGKVRSNDDLIFYNQPTGAEGAVRIRGKTSSIEERYTAFADIVEIDMDDLPDSVERLVLAASLDGEEGGCFGRLAYLRLRLLKGSDAEELIRFDISDATVETAFVFGEIYRRAGQWKFRAVGQGYKAGLAALVTDYGIEVEPNDDQGLQPGEDESEADADDAAAVKDNGDTTADSGLASDGQGADVESQSVESARSGHSPAVAGRTQAISTKKRRTARRLSSSRRRRVASSGIDQNWQAARLFPVAGIGGAEEQERRATSALLAVISSVREFGRSITTRFGAPAGQIDTFIEVPFVLSDQPYVPDGLIRVKRGQRVWQALVEVKTGTAELRQDQVETYLDIAREQRFDAVLTISNRIAAVGERHPVPIDGRKTKKVGVHHLSWAEVRFYCQLLIENNGVADQTQEYILTEFLRYLEHARSGAHMFDDMGPHWVPVRDSVANGTLRPSDKGLPFVTGNWSGLVDRLFLVSRLAGTPRWPEGPGRWCCVVDRAVGSGCVGWSARVAAGAVV